MPAGGRPALSAGLGVRPVFALRCPCRPRIARLAMSTARKDGKTIHGALDARHRHHRGKAGANSSVGSRLKHTLRTPQQGVADGKTVGTARHTQ